MVDLSSQQFYEYNTGDSGTSGGNNRSLFSRRNLFIGGGILLLIVAIVVTALVMRNRPAPVQMSEEDVNSIVERRLADCALADDVAACEQRVYTSVARETGAVELCESTSENMFRSCVSNVAYDQLDADLCRLLDGDARETCQDTIHLTFAQRTLEIDSCDLIENEETKLQCIAIVESQIVAQGECVRYGVDPAKCESKDRIVNAAQGDPALCQALEDEDEVAGCLELITSQDRDDDGLTSYDEFLLGTSDDNPDTDGDGYSDSEESINNFDPLS